MITGPYEADVAGHKEQDGLRWPAEFPHTKDALSERFALFGFNFVPLVTKEINLNCDLEILYLRPDRPGGILQLGDIDNRLKTLFDCLKIPDPNERWSDHSPTEDEQPFYVLLEDDNLITKVSLETDVLLDTAEPRPDDARLVITVRLRPFEVHLGNISFV